jgi:excisionase family DNA binding protein
MVRYSRKHAEDLLHQEEYTQRELANLLNTSEDFLNQQVWRGDLAAVKVGDEIYRFRRSDVLEWLEEHRKEPAR